MFPSDEVAFWNLGPLCDLFKCFSLQHLNKRGLYLLNYEQFLRLAVLPVWTAGSCFLFVGVGAAFGLEELEGKLARTGAVDILGEDVCDWLKLGLKSVGEG